MSPPFWVSGHRKEGRQDPSPGSVHSRRLFSSKSHGCGIPGGHSLLQCGNGRLPAGGQDIWHGERPVLRLPGQQYLREKRTSGELPPDYWQNSDRKYSVRSSVCQSEPAGRLPDSWWCGCSKVVLRKYG